MTQAVVLSNSQVGQIEESTGGTPGTTKQQLFNSFTVGEATPGPVFTLDETPEDDVFVVSVNGITYEEDVAWERSDIDEITWLNTVYTIVDGDVILVYFFVASS